MFASTCFFPSVFILNFIFSSVFFSIYLHYRNRIVSDTCDQLFECLHLKQNLTTGLKKQHKVKNRVLETNSIQYVNLLWSLRATTFKLNTTLNRILRIHWTWKNQFKKKMRSSFGHLESVKYGFVSTITFLLATLIFGPRINFKTNRMAASLNILWNFEKRKEKNTNKQHSTAVKLEQCLES